MSTYLVKRRQHWRWDYVCTETQRKIDECPHDEAYHGECIECGEEDVCDHNFDADNGFACLDCQQEPW